MQFDLEDIIWRLAPELANWVSSCPDLQAANRAVSVMLWLEADDHCHDCGKASPRKELRYGLFDPYHAGELICRGCWDVSSTPTQARPVRPALPFPERLDPLDKPVLIAAKDISKLVIDGFIL